MVCGRISQDQDSISLSPAILYSQHIAQDDVRAARHQLPTQVLVNNFLVSL